MKTRRILAASTAALLAFGTAAVVADATATADDLKPSTTSADQFDFDDMDTDKDTWNDLCSGVSVKVTAKAAETNKDYSLIAAAGDEITVGDIFEITEANGPVSVKDNTALTGLNTTTMNKIKKVLKAKDATSSTTVNKYDSKVRIFEIAVGYNEDADEVPVDSIKLKADVTVRLSTSFAKGKVYHVNGKTLEEVKTTNTKKADNTEFYYTFTTNQFSPYIILEDISFSGLSSVGTASTTSDTSAADPANSDGATSTNPDTGIALAIAPVVLAAGAVAVVALKKKH